MENSDAVVQVSGGIDSAAAALIAAKTYRLVYPLFIDFHAPYSAREGWAAKVFVDHLRERYSNVAPLRFREVTLDAEGDGPYIPARNGVLGLMSVNVAATVGATVVVVGSKTDALRPDDPYCFPDCTADFYRQMGALSRTMLNNYLIRFEQPLRGWAKADAIAMLRGENFSVESLWSCYAGGERPCGECYHCRERAALGVSDAS